LCALLVGASSRGRVGALCALLVGRIVAPATRPKGASGASLPVWRAACAELSSCGEP